jgi:hypothetical protein
MSGSTRDSSEASNSALGEVIERALPWAIGGLAAAAVGVVGGVHAPTQVALSAAALVLVAAYAFVLRGERGLRVVPLTLPCAVAVAYTLFQLLPLPAPLVGLLSPNARALRAETGGGGVIPITLDVAATWLAAVRGAACLGLLILIGGYARARERSRPILFCLALLGGAMALLTIGQRLVGAKSILGVYRLHSQPGSGFFGTFVNGNHAASLLSLTALVGAGLALELRGPRRGVAAACALLSAVTVPYTLSRTGALGLAVGGFVLAVVVLSRRMGRARGVISAIVLLLVAVSVSLWAADGLRSRLFPESASSLWENQKVRGFRDAAALTRAYALTGVGRGAFETAVDAYRVQDEGVRLVYPENVLLQIGSEWGIPVAAGLLVLIAIGFARLLVPFARLEAGIIGAAAGVLAVLVHELADFGLEMPGVAFPAAIALGVVIARSEDQSRAKRTKRRRVALPVSRLWLAAWAVTIVCGAWAAAHTLDVDFDRAHEAVKAHRPEAAALLDAAIARHPASDALELLAAQEALPRTTAGGLKHLNRALRLHPANWQGHRLAARTLAQMGRKGQAALEYRLATEHGMSGVTSAEIWSVVGDHVIDAMPQRAAELIGLAHELVRHGRPDLADQAAIRATEHTDRVTLAMRARLEVAVEAGRAETVIAAATALVDAEPEVQGYAAAAQAFAKVHAPERVDDAIARGMKAHPDESSLVLLGARLSIDRGDLQGARALLKRTADGTFSLKDREEAEDLLAQIAERSGDPDAAVLARARARLLARRRLDTAQTEYGRKP